MEQIYTVKVRCEPSKSQAYPSERAYSSSTVGGLAALHLILSLFGGLLLLPAIPYSGELGLACGCLLAGGVASSVAGLLASKLWYVDRYIRWFLGASSFSVLTSALSSILVSLVALQPSLKLLQGQNLTLAIQEEGIIKRELFIHIFLSAIIEFLISLQSVKIAVEGVRNLRLASQSSPSCTLDRRVDIPSPDVKPHSYYADVMKELCRLQKNALLADGGELGRNIVSSLYAVTEQHERLPRPETQKEYNQRMENFLSYHESNINKD